MGNGIDRMMGSYKFYAYFKQATSRRKILEQPNDRTAKRQNSQTTEQPNDRTAKFKFKLKKQLKTNSYI
jgi:hypothetical protein